jgi:long-chain acyl-CoA synthetase
MTPLSFWNAARQDPSHLAIVNPDGTETTAGELLASANQVVHALRSLGLERGGVIAAVLKNDVAMLELFMAAAQAGWYLTPINCHLTAHEIAYILEDSGAGALVCSEASAETCRKAADQAGFPADRRFVVGEAAGFRSYASLKEGQPVSMPAERRAGLPMTYTSGTTGRPKGVRRKLPDVEPEVVSGSYAMFPMLFGMTPGGDGVHLVVSPLYHTAVLSFATNALHLGHTLVLMDRWTPEGTLERIERYRVTSSHMVPTQFHRLLALPEEVRRRYDLSSVRNMIHSAAPCPPEIKRRMIEWWGPSIYEYYAAAEGGGTVARPEEWLEHPGTVGRPWPGAEVRVLDDDGRECAPLQVGTVYMKMAQGGFEYHRDQKKTQAAWRDGYFTVGDAGYFDEAGYLFLCDRKADMIISGGVNIYPAEIEAALLTHPAVADAAVFGVPDDDWGEQVKAVIEPARTDVSQEALTQELLAFLRERLAAYKIPRTIDYVDALPRDPNGKLYKRKLRDPYWVGRERAI